VTIALSGWKEIKRKEKIVESREEMNRRIKSNKTG